MRKHMVYDVIEKDGEKHIVIHVTNGNEIETMPIRKFVEKSRVINVDGEYMTIHDYLNEEVEKILESTQTEDTPHAK